MQDHSCSPTKPMNIVGPKKSQSQLSNQLQQYGDLPKPPANQNVILTQADLHKALKAIIDEEFNKKMEGIRTMIESTLNEYLTSIGKSTIANKRSVKARANPNHVKLSNFGQENYSYLLMPYLSTQIKASHDMYSLLQKIVVDLYFNSDRKSNNIIYIPPSSYKVITVYIDGAWKNFDLNTTLEKIVRRANDVMQHYLVGAEEEEEKRFRQEIGSKKFDVVREFTDKIDTMEDDTALQERLIHDTERTIITHQHMIHRHIYDIPEDT